MQYHGARHRYTVPLYVLQRCPYPGLVLPSLPFFVGIAGEHTRVRPAEREPDR